MEDEVAARSAIRIAIVEDDADQRGFYADTLRRAGYCIDEYDSREQAQQAFDRALPDLAILDICLRDDSNGGFALCRYLKQRDARLPVLVLTSRGDEIDHMYGLQLGAWDYQTKPVSLDLLEVRVASMLRIGQSMTGEAALTPPPAAGAAPLQLDGPRMRASWKGQVLPLTPTEFCLLQKLAETEGVVSNDELVKATRQGVVEDNTIATHIMHIRKKFRAIDPAFEAIETRYGLGYQWVE